MGIDKSAPGWVDSKKLHEQDRVERIFKDIENQLGIPSTEKPFQMSVTIFSERWQALKEREGVK